MAHESQEPIQRLRQMGFVAIARLTDPDMVDFVIGALFEISAEIHETEPDVFTLFTKPTDRALARATLLSTKHLFLVTDFTWLEEKADPYPPGCGDPRD